MPQLVWQEERRVTPIKVGDVVTDLIPGAIHHYLVVQWRGRSYKLRVPEPVFQLLA